MRATYLPTYSGYEPRHLTLTSCLSLHPVEAEPKIGGTRGTAPTHPTPAAARPVAPANEEPRRAVSPASPPRPPRSTTRAAPAGGRAAWPAHPVVAPFSTAPGRARKPGRNTHPSSRPPALEHAVGDPRRAPPSRPRGIARCAWPPRPPSTRLGLRLRLVEAEPLPKTRFPPTKTERWCVA